MKPVVREDKRSRAGVPDEQTAWAMGFLCGLTVAAVGALDNALLFYPAQWASLDWEFGTISGLIEGLPLVLVREKEDSREYRLGKGGSAVKISTGGEVLLRSSNSIKTSN